MRIVFRDLGLRKLHKVVECETIIGFNDLAAFIEAEAAIHLPKGKDLELVPTDGHDLPLSTQFAIVHYDVHSLARGMGSVHVYP